MFLNPAPRVAGGSGSPGTRCFAAWPQYGPVMACTACGRMLTVGRRSFMRACRAVPPGTASLRPGTQWECARHAATMSYWTGLFVPDKYVARFVPAGGADAFVLGL